MIHDNYRNYCRTPSRVSLERRKEIVHLVSRGKDVGYIAVWLRMPVSKVNQVIQEEKEKEGYSI